MPALKFQIKRKCEMCGATFIAKTLESKYCSKHNNRRIFTYINTTYYLHNNYIPVTCHFYQV